MNPAQRLLNIINILDKGGANESLLLLLAKCDPQSTDRPDVTGSRVLTAARNCCERIETLLMRHGVPEQLYRESLDYFRDYITPGNGHTSWTNGLGVGSARDQARNSLRWMAFTLDRMGENESEIPADVLDELNQLLEQQRSLLREEQLPAGLQQLLEEQVAELELAMRLTPSQGVGPLRAAAEKAAGQLFMRFNDIKGAAEAEGPKAKTVLAKSVELVDRFSKVTDAAAKGIKNWETLKPALTHAFQVLQDTLK